MLGEYFRFITRNGEDNVRLSEEIRHSRMYTEIQKLRFSRRIQVQFDELPKDMERIRVPRLIIQPIIENAYEHSLEKMTDEGLLCVSFDMDQEEARIVVEDNGNPISDFQIEALQATIKQQGESREMTGHEQHPSANHFIYGEDSGLFLSRSEINGLKVEIRIKAEEESVTLYRLLIVDDEDIITDSLIRGLSTAVAGEAGCLQSLFGQGSFEWMSRTRIDIVLTDISMPGMNGLELSEEFRPSGQDARLSS